MSNPNDKIEVTNDGRLFFSNGLSKIEGNINITISQDGKYYPPTESQENTFEILKNRKDILPYPLDTFLQAFKESNNKMGKLIIARYIIILSNKKFPYNTYKYLKTMRDVKKLFSYYHPSFKFGREVAKRTNEKLWRRIQQKYYKSNKGGKPGQWSARKAQLAVQEYKKKGGKYVGNNRKKTDLHKWTKEDWGTRSGRPSIQGKKASGERYLPRKAREALSEKEYKRTTAAKRKGIKEGKQFVRQPKKIAKKTAKYRKYN